MNKLRAPVCKYRVKFSAFVCAFAMLSLLSAPGRAQKNAPAPELLPTGQAITPTAAPLSRFQTLKPGLAGYPNHEVGYAVSTAVGPDDGTLLVLTSGYTEVRDKKGVKDKSASMEFIFVFDITKG